MRATSHNARTGKDGTFSAKHNDRNFDLNNAEHINKEKTSQNITGEWTRTGISFEESEKKYYEEHFRAFLDCQNAKYQKNRNKRDQKTMDEYRKSKRTCPEETIYQIGRKDDTISPDLLSNIVAKQIAWEAKTYPNVKILNYALHVDEQGAPHVHIRKIWIAHDKAGNLRVNQNGALEEMGIERPDPDKKQNRYNNPKMTYTRDCRQHLLEVCRTYGLEIETDPLEKSKTGLSLDAYKARQEQEKLERAKAEAEKIKEDLKQQTDELAKKEEDLNKRELDLKNKEQELTNKEDKINKLAIVTLNKHKELQALIDSVKDWQATIKQQFNDIIARIFKKTGSDRENSMEQYMKWQLDDAGESLWLHYQDYLRDVAHTAEREINNLDWRDYGR
ncbi:hypothetical protein [uncultured Cloacibacillus sp.]|uniref:hypothetical protein n=1 Tax=uncultured Cloacibacillus sp. TaxID=889794 RepID=UPI0025F654B8|nr:hypothetical protein [uncultured Cloacibacillus sp.]